MTKEEIIKIIDQNRDLLTPENVQGYIQNIDLFSEREWEEIATYLDGVHKLIGINNRYLNSQSRLYSKAIAELDGVQADLASQKRIFYKGRESSFLDSESRDAEKLINNL
jgi:hypothetical protein